MKATRNDESEPQFNRRMFAEPMQRACLIMQNEVIPRQCVVYIWLRISSLHKIHYINATRLRLSNISAARDLLFLVYSALFYYPARVIHIALILYVCRRLQAMGPFASQIFNECKYAFAWQILRVTFLFANLYERYCHVGLIVVALLVVAWRYLSSRHIQSIDRTQLLRNYIYIWHYDCTFIALFNSNDL